MPQLNTFKQNIYHIGKNLILKDFPHFKMYTTVWLNFFLKNNSTKSYPSACLASKTFYPIFFTFLFEHKRDIFMHLFTYLYF